MSNRLSCLVASNDYLRIDPLVGDQVRIEVYEADGSNYVHLNRDDFIDYLAENMNLTIIRNEEFPEVELKDGWIVSNGTYQEELDRAKGSNEIRREAIKMLAIAEFLEANPPVNELQVVGLAMVLADERSDDAGIAWPDYLDEARRLYLAGVRVGGDDK